MSDSTDPRRRQDRDQLKLLAIFHFLLGGLMLLGIGFLVLHYFLMQTIFKNPQLLKAQAAAQGNPQFAFDQAMRVLIVFYVLAGGACVLASALNVFSGLCLLHRKNRIFSIVIAALDCLAFPLGTALGVFTLIALSRESVAEIYRETAGDHARPAIS